MSAHYRPLVVVPNSSYKTHIVQSTSRATAGDELQCGIGTILNIQASRHWQTLPANGLGIGGIPQVTVTEGDVEVGGIVADTQVDSEKVVGVADFQRDGATRDGPVGSVLSHISSSACRAG